VASLKPLEEKLSPEKPVTDFKSQLARFVTTISPFKKPDITQLPNSETEPFKDVKLNQTRQSLMSF
jgi:hypothetical protein